MVRRRRLSVASAPIQLGYNLYRGLEPGLATYFKDPSRATKFANLTAPFVRCIRRQGDHLLLRGDVVRAVAARSRKRGVGRSRRNDQPGRWQRRWR